MTDAQTKAIAALEAYGYVLKGKRWAIPGRRTQEWEASGEGFTRFDPGEGQPMPHRGLTQDEADALNDQRAKDGKDRLNLALHNFRDPAHYDLYVWEWPAEYVEKVYSTALAEQLAEEVVE